MIDKINPLLKMVTTLIISFSLAFVYNYKLNLSIIFICILLILTSKRVRLQHALVFIVPITFASLGTFFTAFYYMNENSEIVKNLSEMIISKRVTIGIILSTRIIAYSMLGIIFVLTVDKMNWIYNLMKYLKLPPYYAYSMLISVTLVPMIKKEFDHAKLSLKLRDNTTFSNTKVLTNMLIHSIKWSELAALSMEAKGFQNEGRSYYINPKIKSWEVVFCIACLVAFFVSIGQLK